MLIMLHSINQGRAEGRDAITDVTFGRMMDDLHEQQFQAITSVQLAAFLETNAEIPERSVVVIQDGRRYPENFDRHFRPYWEAWGWPVVNGWEYGGDASEALWKDYAALAGEGVVDFQVYGPSFGASVEEVDEAFLVDGLRQPMETLEERLGRKPLAVVWPNGFNLQSAQTARRMGYRLGFTFNARGPLMYNWVPLADGVDRLRPSYKPDGPVGDPLMTLPRYWPHQVHDALDQVRLTGKEAAAYARQNKAVELQYYDIMCASRYGPIFQQ